MVRKIEKERKENECGGESMYSVSRKRSVGGSKVRSDGE